MKLLITDCTVINEYDFSPEFDIFHSICYSNEKEYIFSRHVKKFNWWNTKLKIDNTFINYGEDPRAFDFLGSPACYTAKWSNFRPDSPYIKLRPNLTHYSYLYVKDNPKYNYLRLKINPNIITGKNWSPFVYQNEIHFVHEFSPFRVLKLIDDTVYELFAIDFPSEIQPIDSYTVLRGGSNGLDIGDNLILGFGHLSIAESDYNAIIHRPFGWTIDMSTEQVDVISLEFDWDIKYNIIDPTSFFIKNGKYYLMTCETQYNHWEFNINQTGRSCLYTIEILK